TPHYLRIKLAADAPLGVSNEGFRGMGVRVGDEYDFSATARVVEGSPNVTVEIVGEDGTTLATAPLKGKSSEWGKVTTTLRPKDTDAHARMTIILQGRG